MKRLAVAASLALSFGLAGGLPATAAAAPAPADTIAQTVPPLNHVFVIVLENKSYSDVWDKPGNVPYLRSLRALGAFASQYYGVTHPSAGNYIAQTSGQTPGPNSEIDCPSWQGCKNEASLTGGRSIADEINDRGLSWRGYMDGMSQPCQHGPALGPDPYQNGYATRHNPFVYYSPIVDNPARCNAGVVPFTSLATDLQSSATTPSLSYIVPDTCHDGHDVPCKPAQGGGPGGLPALDAWLAQNVPPILASPAYNDRGALFITFDEADFEKGNPNDDVGCCLADGVPPAPPGGGRTGLVALSPLARQGATTDRPYNHYSLLSTMEAALGIPTRLGNAGTLPGVHPMADLFRGPAAAVVATGGQPTPGPAVTSNPTGFRFRGYLPTTGSTPLAPLGLGLSALGLLGLLRRRR